MRSERRTATAMTFGSGTTSGRALRRRAIATASLATTSLALCVSALAGCSPCGSSADLVTRLAAARAGDVIEVGACAYEGSFTVPAGVTLRGAGPDRTTFRLGTGGVDTGIALDVSVADGVATVIEGISVDSSGCAGIVLRGAGDATLRDVTVHADRGLAIGAESLRTATLERVSVEGLEGEIPDDVMVPLPPYDCATADPATHGLVMIDVGSASLIDVSSRGFVGFGALFVGTELEWSGGQVVDHVGAGIEVFGGRAVLSDLEICRSRQVSAPIESFNGLFAGGATIESERLTVCDGEVFGLMHDDAVASHVDLRAIGNRFAGVWAQRAESFSLRGPGSLLERNGFAGVATLGVANVTIEDAEIRETAPGTAPMGAATIRAADGIHMIDSESATLRNLRMIENERVGLLLDLGGASTATSTIESVVVEGSGEQLGAVAQDGTVVPGWDSAVTRVGAPAVNDALVTGPLDVAGILGPSCFPDPSAVVTAGLSGLIR
jgi:hypothetical protein